MTDPTSGFTDPFSKEARAVIELGRTIQALREASCMALDMNDPRSSAYFAKTAAEADLVFKEFS